MTKRVDPLQTHSLPPSPMSTVHRGRDNVIYMLDFARLFPPEHRANAHLKPEHRTGHEIFYQLLRPELVRANPRPLCSDALSGWGRHGNPAREFLGHICHHSLLDVDPNFKQHNADLREACERMRTQCVIGTQSTTLFPAGGPFFWFFISLLASPECASILDAASLPDSSSLLSPATIRSELHRAGLGMRLLGLVRAACTNMTTRTLLLTEMVRRCLVCAVREQLRVLGDRAGFGFSALFTRHVHALLDTLLGGSLPFWRVQVREMVEAKYGVPLHWLPTDAGAAVWQNDASRAICVPVLIRSLSESWGFDAPPQPTVTAGALIVPANGLISMPLPPLVPSSMQPERFLAPRLKFSNFAHLVRGRALLVRAQQLIVQLHYTTARHFLDAARESLSSASASAPFNSNIASDLLHCMLHQALLLRSDARILAQVHVDSKRLIQLRVATDCMMCAFVAACTSTYQKALTALRPMQAQAVAAVTSSLVETLATWDHVFSAHGLTQRWRLVLLLLMVRHAPMEPDDRATYLCALLSSLLQFEPRMGNFSSIVSFVEELWTTPTDADLDARMIPLVGEQEWRYGRALRDMLHELLTQCKPAAAVELRSVLLGLGPARLRIVALHVLCVSSPVALTMGGSGDNDDDDGGRSRMFQLVDERLQDAPLDAVDAFLVPIVSAAGFAESTEVLQSSRNVCAHLSLYRVLRGLVSDVHLCSAIVNARAVYPFGAHVPSTQLRSISHSNLRASTHTAAVMTFLARAVPGAALLTRVSLHGDTLDVSALPLLAAAPKLAALKLESFSLGNGEALTALLVARNTTLTELDLSWCSWDAETEATLALPLAFPHLHTVTLRHLERAPKPLVRVALATARKVTLGGDWTGLGNPLKRCARVELLIFMDLDGWLPLVAALSSTHLGTLQQLHFRGSSSWQCHEVAHADALVALVTRVPALLTLHIDPRLSGDGALALALRLLVLRQWNAFSCEALRVPADHALWPAATALRVLRLGQRSQMSAAHYLALVAQATELRAFKVSLDRAEVQLLAPIYEGPACQHLRLVELHENIGSNPDAQVQALLLACPRLTTLGLFEVPNITEACLVEADEASFARLIRVHLVCFSANSLRLLQTVLQRSHTLALRHLEIAVTVRTEAEGDAIAVAAELVSARGVVVDRNAPYYFIPEVYDEFIEQ